ncbi:MAG TPA: hypothetical protein VEU75_01425 [Candidatus Acidoferrum sp.]|nr:hypothetical protein [Candidatus Acidoferrum sp.]
MSRPSVRIKLVEHGDLGRRRWPDPLAMLRIADPPAKNGVAPARFQWLDRQFIRGLDFELRILVCYGVPEKTTKSENLEAQTPQAHASQSAQETLALQNVITRLLNR